MLFKEIPNHFPGFTFTDEDQLSGFLSDDRFRHMIFHEQTSVHALFIASPDYGEFIFLTASITTPQGQVTKGFYGLGFHEYGQEWLV